MSNLFNPILAQWFKGLNVPVPPVDCERCTLAGLEPAQAQRWARYKCCTFQPYVANFYCGAMLEAGLSPFRDRAIFQAIGVVATRAFRGFNSATPEADKGDANLCTFFNREERNCGIRDFRPGECGLYFCGPGSAAREQLAQQALHLESGIAQMALAHFGYSPRAICVQLEHLNAPSEGLVSLSRPEAEEIYRFSWAWLQRLDRSEVLSWTSFTGKTGL